MTQQAVDFMTDLTGLAIPYKAFLLYLNSKLRTQNSKLLYVCARLWQDKLFSLLA